MKQILMLGVGLVVVALVTVGFWERGSEARLESIPVKTQNFGMRTNGGLFDPDSFETTEEWLGRSIDYTVQFSGRRSPHAMNSAVFGLMAAEDASLPAYADRLTLVISVPLAFSEPDENGPLDGREGLLATAEGRHDTAYLRLAERLIEGGYGDAILRLGHEFNGGWPPWSSLGNEDAFIAAYRHVHDLFQAQSAGFEFDWTAMRPDFATTAPAAWPGIDYVDYIGLDVYWKSDPGDGWDSDRWQSQFLPQLEAHLAFAKERGLPVSFPEWGIEGDDVPEFIEQMHTWFNGLPPSGPGSLGYQAYFSGGRAFSLDNYVDARRTFRQLFGAP
ncbi:MAG: glycosyl hydrolase [Actinomycetota bacterium]